VTILRVKTHGRRGSEPGAQAVTTVRIGKLGRHSPDLQRIPFDGAGDAASRMTRRTATGLTGVDFDNWSYAGGAIVNQDDLVYAAFELN
jgi:hypothetical protein